MSDIPTHPPPRRRPWPQTPAGETIIKKWKGYLADERIGLACYLYAYAAFCFGRQVPPVVSQYNPHLFSGTGGGWAAECAGVRAWVDATIQAQEGRKAA